MQRSRAVFWRLPPAGWRPCPRKGVYKRTHDSPGTREDWARPIERSTVGPSAMRHHRNRLAALLVTEARRRVQSRPSTIRITPATIGRKTGIEPLRKNNPFPRIRFVQQTRHPGQLSEYAMHSRHLDDHLREVEGQIGLMRLEFREGFRQKDPERPLWYCHESELNGFGGGRAQGEDLGISQRVASHPEHRQKGAKRIPCRNLDVLSGGICGG